MRRRLGAFLCALLLGCATPPSPTPRPPVSPPSPALTWASLARLHWPARQHQFAGYGRPVRDALWQRVYSDGGIELYCRAPFDGTDARARRLNGEQLQLEHVFPADLIAEQFGYDDRNCERPLRAQPDLAGCRAATGDMENLLAAYGRINASRGNHPYGELTEIEGTNNLNYAELCPDFERASVDGRIFIEPDDEAQGDIARSLIYMHFVYGLDLSVVIDEPNRLLEWAIADPVTETERRRERHVRQAQPGSWNPLVLAPDPPTS